MYHLIYLFTLCMYVCVSTLKDNGWGQFFPSVMLVLRIKQHVCATS